MAHEVTIYTDGACSGNPGPGGYGVVLISGSHRKEISEGFRLTTNNRMELLAAITGLEALKNPGTDGETAYRLTVPCQCGQQRMAVRLGKKTFRKEKKPGPLDPLS